MKEKIVSLKEEKLEFRSKIKDLKKKVDWNNNIVAKNNEDQKQDLLSSDEFKAYQWDKEYSKNIH